jgi:hypothetical protein
VSIVQLKEAKMPLEEMEEQGLAKIPDLGVAQLKFQLQTLKYTNPTAKQQVNIHN